MGYAGGSHLGLNTRPNRSMRGSRRGGWKSLFMLLNWNELALTISFKYRKQFIKSCRKVVITSTYASRRSIDKIKTPPTKM